MKDIEKNIKKYNDKIAEEERRKVKQERRKKIKENIEKITNKMRELKESAQQKIEQHKESVQTNKQLKAERLARQKELDGIYRDYIEFANANQHKIGTKEIIGRDNDESATEVVYTEHGPLIKDNNYYTGFVPSSADENAPLVFARLGFKRGLTFGSGKRGDYHAGVFNLEFIEIDGVVRQNGVMTEVSQRIKEKTSCHDRGGMEMPSGSPEFIETELLATCARLKRRFEKAKASAFDYQPDTNEEERGLN